jgi:hypothetical protein
VSRCIRGDYLVCFLPLHTRLRVQRAPGIPHALCFRAKDSSKARTHRAAGRCRVFEVVKLVEFRSGSCVTFIVVPANAGTHNHRTLCCAKVVEQRLLKQPPRGMGPCVRRDDAEKGGRRCEEPKPGQCVRQVMGFARAQPNLRNHSSAWPYPAIRPLTFSISALDSSGGVPIWRQP